jgi:hypothetical protein
MFSGTLFSYLNSIPPPTYPYGKESQLLINLPLLDGPLSSSKGEISERFLAKGLVEKDYYPEKLFFSATLAADC